MATVFSSLVRPAILRRPSTDPQVAIGPPLSHGNDPAEETDLRNLNTSLQALTEIFPDVQPEVFREMLASFSEESRLQVVTEALLKHGSKWVRGRYRMPAEQEEQKETAHKYKYRERDLGSDTRGKPLSLEDTFRSKQYKEAAKQALYQEFKGLSHSTIRAVLAEFNWSYTQARPTLLVLSSKSWRSSITNFLMRRKAPSAKDHPLVLWTAADARTGRPRTPLLIKTKDDELNRELHENLIVPELARRRNEQVQQDFDLARKLHAEEAEREGEMYDCECCFVQNAPHQMSTCDIDGHFICFRCIRHAISAALYDQGWSRNINTELCTLKCIAPVTDGDCQGCIPLSFVHRALLEEKDGDDNVTKLDERFNNEALIKSQLPLARCPFCSYAELDDFALATAELLASLRPKPHPILLASLASVPLIELLCFRAIQTLVFLLVLLYAFLAQVFHVPIITPFQSALRRIRLKRRGLRFQCLSPTCRRPSCLSCSAPWHDPHTCYSSQVTSLRLTLERATTDAVKRTCPQCNLGFVKSEGCNKLVCLCGYSMCYICRQGLAEEGYHHFCQHFRERPGETCRECSKCDLYRVEDEERVMRRAKEAAEAEWWESQGEMAQRDLRNVVGKGKSQGIFGAEKKDWKGWTEGVVETFLM